MQERKGKYVVHICIDMFTAGMHYCSLLHMCLNCIMTKEHFENMKSKECIVGFLFLYQKAVLDSHTILGIRFYFWGRRGWKKE